MCPQMAISFWRDSDSADLGNEGIGSLGYVTTGNTNSCGVINLMLRGFVFGNEELRASREQNSVLDRR